MNKIDIIASELNLTTSQVDAVLHLLLEGNTIPFIARYRKEVTGSLDDEILRKLDERNTYLTNLEERKDTVIKSITEQGKMTEELLKQIDDCLVLNELEDIYRPYKPKKKTRAVIAKEKGLEPLADFIYIQLPNKPLEEFAKTFINEEKGVLTVEDAVNGAKDIIAEVISDSAEYRTFIKKIDKKKALIVSKEIAKEEKGVYDKYADYQELISKIAPHRVLALNRGEKQKFLKVKLETPDDEIIDYLSRKIIVKDSPFRNILLDVIKDSYNRLIAPSIENELRSDLQELAEEVSMNVFKENLHQLLLVSPIKHKVVLGFDPGYAHGCKIAVVDETGKVLDTTVIYPTKPREQIERSQFNINRLIS